MDTDLSATKYLLRALDAGWAYEDTQLMQLIADAIDRCEKLESADGANTVGNHARKPVGLPAQEPASDQRANTATRTGKNRTEHIREVTTQVIELYDPAFADSYRQWTDGDKFETLLNLASQLQPNDVEELIETAERMRFEQEADSDRQDLSKAGS